MLIEVDENHAGQRLDNFLITLLKGVPKTHVYKVIRKGEVRINKGRVKQTTRLQQGDVVRVPPVRMTSPTKSPLNKTKFAFLNEAILFEDESLLVINKPSGMAVHSGSGVKVGVIEALRSLRQDLPYIELVHRLDRETSGVLVLAKKMSVLRALSADFANNSETQKRVDKRYLTLVKGFWKSGERKVTKALNTDSRRAGERYVTVSSAGAYACSIMRPVQKSKLASLLGVSLLTGRTHQVRVHAQSEGHPVAGDSRYGDDQFNKQMRNEFGLRRLFLHASEIRFKHPVSGVMIEIQAPLPSELEQVVESLSMEPV